MEFLEVDGSVRDWKYAVIVYNTQCSMNFCLGFFISYYHQLDLLEIMP